MSGSTAAEAGFTFIETMVALLCFMAVLWGFWALGSRAFRAFSSSSARAGSVARAALVDQAIRREAARLRIPFWARQPGCDAADSSLSLPYLDGKADESLSIHFTDGKLILEAGDEHISLNVDQLESIKPILADGGVLAGLELVYSIGGRSYSTRAPLSGVSLVPAEAGK